MRIVYLYQPGRLVRIPDLRSGGIPTEFFYGAPELEIRGHDVEYLEVHDTPAINKLRIAVELLIRPKYLPAKVYFSLFFGVKKILPALQEADVVVATTPGIAFSLTMWRWFSNAEIPRACVAIHCGILKYSQNGIRLMLSRYLFRKMWTQLFGEGELEAMKTCFRIPDQRIMVNCFGIDEKFWTPPSSGERGDYVLAVGNDAMRDYELLVQAAEGIGKTVKLLTRRALPPNLPDNIEVLHGSWHTQALGDDELRELYRRAFCVIVPLKNSIQPAGQSVTLQAMACGTPVILTRTDGLWENKNLRHGENVLFVESGQVSQLVDAVRLLESDTDMWQKMSCEGRNYVMEHGRIVWFADRMETMCKLALSSGK